MRRLRAGREQRNEQTTVARALALLGPAKYEAEAKAADIAKVEGGQGLDERRREVGRLMAEAGKALEAGDMDQALPRFRTVSRACDAFMALAVARDKAVAQKTAATAARAKAATEGADVRAKGKWAQAEGLNTQATTLSAAGSYSEAEPLWKGAAEAYAVAAAAGTAARGYSDLAALLERETSAWDPGLRKRLGGSAWSDVQRAREEALALAAREEYAAALVRLEAAQASWARCAAALASERDREIFTQAMARGNDQLAREHWREAEAQFTVALQSPAFKANPEARAGLVKAQTGRLLATACAARDSGAWRDVQDLARKALALTADSDLARLLAAQAKENLIPRLTVQAHYQGGSVTVARVSMNGNPVAETLPATVVLEPGRDYTLRVEAPIQADGAALHTAESQFRAHDAGRRDLDIALEPITAPEPGRVWAVPGTDLALMPIPAGSFRMGSEKGRKDEVPAHKVRLSKPFWCGRSEVTNRQYRDFLADSKYDGAGDALVYLLHFSGSSEMSKDDKAPVCYVSWSNAVAFGEWLSAREQRGGRLPKGYVYRLPTEAEWEYVARAGEENDYTDDPRLMAWYAGNATQNQVVMTRAPSKWGICDMYGNVWEWCQDWMDTYEPADVVNPKGPAIGMFKVVRGGSWQNELDMCRASYRTSVARPESKPNIGFRVVLAPE